MRSIFLDATDIVYFGTTVYDFDDVYNHNDIDNYNVNATDKYIFEDNYVDNQPKSTKQVQKPQTTVYDFSDEAQAAFNAQQNVQMQINQPVHNPTIEKTKNRKVKNNNGQSRTTAQNILNNQANTSSQSVDVFHPSSNLAETQISKVVHATTAAQTSSLIKGSVVYVPEGSSFMAVLQSSISSASLAKNDTIAAVLQNDWYSNGVLIAPLGSIVYGKAIETEKAGLAYGNGSLSISFNEILTPNGEQLMLTSNIVTVQVESQRVKKISAKVVGGAVMGAVAGTLWALITGGDIADGLAVGAGIGGIGGTISAVTKKGEDAEIPAGTGINVRLTKPMNAPSYQEN